MLEDKFGLLLRPDIKIHRKYFEEMVGLLGIKVLFRAPKPSKHYTTYTEIDTNFEKPIAIGCIFEEHPKQETLKKLGWAAELQEGASIIHVAYDTPGIQTGAIFLIPSAIDHAKGRVFRVGKMSTEMIYPASISCEIVPEYENTYSNAQKDYSHTNYNLLTSDDEEDI